MTTIKKKDTYDRAVAFYKKHPNRILQDWQNSVPLFAFLSSDRSILHNIPVGCPTMIIAQHCKTPDPKLTKIVLNSGIPEGFSVLEPKEQIKHLNKFARVQRAADRILKRKKPVWRIPT